MDNRNSRRARTTKAKISFVDRKNNGCPPFSGFTKAVPALFEGVNDGTTLCRVLSNKKLIEKKNDIFLMIFYRDNAPQTRLETVW